jgi:uncharacterized membrane protein
MRPSRFLLRQLLYDFASGLLGRPALWIGTLAVMAMVLPPLELRYAPGLSSFLATEPSSAQVVLGTLAGSMMSVIGVVYSTLLVALSLASMQFSTRILAGMTRDRVAQDTLGMFIGTFVYCLLVLRAVHSEPAPSVPGIAYAGALLLALTALGHLVYFIHHIVQSIQANHLVARIGNETALVIDAVFSVPLPGGEMAVDAEVPAVPKGAAVVLARSSGYVQLIDIDGLRSIAARGASVHLLKPMGAFVTEGLPLLAIQPPPSAADQDAAVAAIDIGAIRTMQQDVEFGIRQIVDIALKAVSPAVNDPSTAATCVDHLGRLLVQLAQRSPLPARHGEGVVVPQTTHGDLIDLCFEQLRQYTRTDMAVSLRIMRVLGEVASVTRHEGARRRLALHARLIDEAMRAAFAAEDCEELGRRRALLDAHITPTTTALNMS